MTKELWTCDYIIAAATINFSLIYITQFVWYLEFFFYRSCSHSHVGHIRTKELWTCIYLNMAAYISSRGYY